MKRYKRYMRNAIKANRFRDGVLHIEPIDRHYSGEPHRQHSPRTSACPGKRWLCDAGCGHGMPRDGLIRHTCPKAHFHRICTLCAIKVLWPLKIESSAREGGYLKRGMEIGPIVKLSRCPFTITDADWAMAALIEPSA